ncbi:tetratricopeptide repeat protein [Paractinoplanes lichenicola]|uniref:Tetratricopeptide repeat protein n=1 Tax=Paractinoplanes lichenicola TaxID=2802976 RepID=A0ABS1W489_9ACTN|nr:tetratricopeptide repeat protein [Actinoplanes lichenicola]MBL7261518.1 tetratricopeptide repeat protein [Actinoplanes lichenicola]
MTGTGGEFVAAEGVRSAALRDSSGIVQTGDRARAVQGQLVPLGQPGDVPVPVPGLVGLPKLPVKSFVGRDEELAELGRLVEAGAGVVAQSQAVHGLGGVGKSELALQYAHTHRREYPLVWWVNADSPESIESGLAELAYRLHPDARIVAQEPDAAGWAVGWLQAHPGWLLILDNVERREDVDGLLADLADGHVVITTRRDVGWERVTDGCLRVEVLTPVAAVALLVRLSEQPDEATAAVLAGELGCLPLALQQAGAYLRQTRTPIASYLRRLREDPGGVLGSVAAGDSARRAVAQVWSVTLEQIGGQSAIAARLLRVLSCLGPDPVPRDVLAGLDLEAVAVDQGLGVLASYNMITLSETTVSVHRLVQAVVADHLRHTSASSPGEQDATSEHGDVLSATIRALKAAAPSGNAGQLPATWPQWSALAPHIAAVELVCPEDIGGVDLGFLLNECAVFEQSQGRYRNAFRQKQRSLTLYEAALGPDHRHVATALDNLANSMQLLGRAAEAEPLHRRALTISETALGPDHPSVAITMNNLANSLQELGRAAEAESLLRRALTISETALGPDHPSVATRLNNLALGLRALGRAAEAESLLRRALTISETALGPHHPDVATTLNNLASSLQALDRAAEAEPLLRRALTISETALGPHHPDVATTLNNLALSLQALDRAAEAEPLLRRALTIAETALGPHHPSVAITLNNLASSLHALGRAAEAEPLLRRALTISETALGPHHPNVTIARKNLASSLQALGRVAEAEPLLRRAREIRAARQIE